MKKVITLILCLLVLTGCSQRKFTPVLNTDFSLNAVYKAGDFSYDCRITKSEKGIEIEALSTRAKGLVIAFNGKTVTLKMGKFKKYFPAESIDSSNPAKLLFGIFDYLENAEEYNVKRLENGFRYTGKTPLGDFVLLQNDDNSYKSLSIPDADIEINFTDK